MSDLQFSSSYAITMMFPFAPFLVRFLLPQVDETDVGKHLVNVHTLLSMSPGPRNDLVLADCACLV